jgi:hypothetical protein
MQRMILDAEAGRLSEELTRRGIDARTRVHAMVEIADDTDLPMAAMAQGGEAFAFLAGEPDLYSDADLAERNG